jgi:nucleoside-diphosphate-sugar epimerase
MIALITGAAGFIGSVMCRHALDMGWGVVGVDNFLDSYPRQIKEDRLQELLSRPGFVFHERDLACCELDDLLDGVSCILHFAAQAGVRTSWGERFQVYTNSNILATQRLLEAARSRDIERFVYSSSSSVYGSAETMPTPETAPTRPISPYAVSKLAGEHLGHLYHASFGVPVVVLRYFTVYGPKPRPDQAACLFTRALLEDREITVYGDGNQLRGMTYVDDVARANLLALERDCVGGTFNVGGGSSVSVNQFIAGLESATGCRARVRHEEGPKGDAKDTQADISLAHAGLGWEPRTDLVEGLRQTVASVRDYYGDGTRGERGS